MSQNHPPKQPTISFQLGWPPVTFPEKHETRGDHALMAVVMTVGTAAAIVSMPVPDTGIVGYLPYLTAWIGGYAFNGWLTFNDLYDDPEASEDGDSA